MSPDRPVDAPPPEAGTVAPVPVVLWRPGCGFCRLLFSGLDRHGVGYELRNIWDDREARDLLNERIGCQPCGGGGAIADRQQPVGNRGTAAEFARLEIILPAETVGKALAGPLLEAERRQLDGVDRGNQRALL